MILGIRFQLMHVLGRGSGLIPGIPLPFAVVGSEYFPNLI